MSLRISYVLGVVMSMVSFGVVTEQTISREELVFLTAAWKGERFSDGRPKIPDELIARARNIAIEDAWTVLHNDGYDCQFEGNWQPIHLDVPVVGRAVTAMYMPSRPDVEQVIKDRGHAQGRVGNTNAWPIDVLAQGDVYVADGFGKIQQGTLIGDNLGNSIFAKSGNGVVFNASSRDLEGLSKIEGFNAFVRAWDPTYLDHVVLMGLNKPIRMGHAVVLPGDLIMAKREGVIFIPAHLVEKVVTAAEFIALRDQFGHAMLKSGKYTPGEIDNQWTDKIKSDFMKWLDKNPNASPLKRSDVERFMEKRTW